MEHSSYTLLKGAIHSLCYSILLRPVAHRVLPFNALRIAKVPHAVAHVFSSLVIAQYANSPVSAVLSPSFEPFELRECHVLRLHGGNTVETSVVIHKGGPVLHASSRARHRAMDICVDELKRIGSARGRGRERSSIELAMKTRLTDRIWRGLCIESHAGDKISNDDALDASMVEVRKATMPQ